MEKSLSLRRAWIEIVGMGSTRTVCAKSLSLRRAWIEISGAGAMNPVCPRRSPYGERGLKSLCDVRGHVNPCRSPYGERGLKCHQRMAGGRQGASLSLRRAWIEMVLRSIHAWTSGRSPYGERGLKSTILLRFHRERAVALLTESVD